MEKFWIIAVANELNSLSERFYSYDEARQEADRRSKMSPNLYFLVLELKGYAKGTMTVDTEYVISDSIEILEFNKGDNAKLSVYFTDDVGNKLDLSNCSVQFIILPSETSNDDNAIFNEIKTYVPTDEEVTELTFTGNKCDFIITSDTTKNIGIFWYKVRLIYHTEPEESVVYKENKFIVK